MDPIAGTDVKRKKRKEKPESEPGVDYLYGLKKFYTSRIRHVEKVIPTLSKKWLYDILIIIKKYYEQVVKLIDSLLKLQIKLDEIKVQNMDLEINVFNQYTNILNFLEKNISIWRNPISPLVNIIRKDETIIKFFLNTPPYLEGLLPSLTEKWLKDLILGIKNNLREIFEPKIFKIPKTTQILERKKKGEYFDDLIKQDRYSAKMKKTILIIKDDPDILGLITKFLKLGDFDPITCSNEEEALKVIEERYNDINMILLDPKMSGLNKEKLTQFIKSDERYKHILVRVFPEIMLPQDEKVKESIERIKSLMKNDSINELTIQRQYLPEIFGVELLEISTGDGLPILKPFVKFYFLSKRISTDIFGNIIKFKKVKLPNEFPKVYEGSEKLNQILENEYKIKELKPILKNEYKVNEFITLKLEENKTIIYIKGKKFMQCIRLALQIPPQENHLYEEVESIDEAAEVYKHYLWENKFVGSPMAYPSLFQNRSITPEQEFWGHCSNLQAWVDHKYDTRLLRSNLSFPLLKKLANAGDGLARKIFKEEIAQRLESGYPSVVLYLINQGYVDHLTSFEFKTIIEATNLIKSVSSQLKMLSNFLQTCAKRFPRILGDIVLKILELPEGKKKLITVSSRNTWDLDFRVPLDSNPKFLEKIKDALKEKLKEVRKIEKSTILDYIQIIDDNVNEEKRQNVTKNFEFEKAELNNIEESLNLKTKEMHEEYHIILLSPPPISQRDFNKERWRLGIYLNSHLIPISRRIRRIGDNLKMKLIELEKKKKKEEM